MKDLRRDRTLRKRLDASDASDVAERLRDRERDARRHTLWALLGVSPAALLPLIATASEFGVWALLGGMMIVVTREALGAIRARAEISELRGELHRLTSEWSSSSFES